MKTFTCTTPGCRNNGAPIVIDWNALEALCQTDGSSVGPVFCGCCGTEITNSGVATPAASS